MTPFLKLRGLQESPLFLPFVFNRPGGNEDILERLQCLSVYQTENNGPQRKRNFPGNLRLDKGKGPSQRENSWRFHTVLTTSQTAEI